MGARAIRAVVFDLDDTLYEEREYALSGFAAVDARLRDCHGIDGFYNEARALFGSDDRTMIFNRALDRLGAAYDADLIGALVECYRNHLPRIRLFGDAAWALKRLKGNVKLGLISDGYLSAQRRKVEALGLASLFDSIVLTDEWGRAYWKPSPLPYETTNSRLGVAPEACVYIGDNVNKDFITANRLGWTTVHVRRDGGIYSKAAAGTEYHAHYRVGDLARLAEVEPLRHLFEGRMNPCVS